MASFNQLLLKLLLFFLLSLFFLLVVKDAVLYHFDTKFSLSFFVISSSRLSHGLSQRIADFCLIIFIIHCRVSGRDSPPVERWCFQVRQCQLLRVLLLTQLTLRYSDYRILVRVRITESGCAFVNLSIILCLSSPGATTSTSLARATGARFSSFLLILFPMDLYSEVAHLFSQCFILFPSFKFFFEGLFVL